MPRPGPRATIASMSNAVEFWPNGARLAVTVSMQFEAGRQPISGAPGPVAELIERGYPDLPQNSFYEYGVTEGIRRILDLFDKHVMRVSSCMSSPAVDSGAEIAHVSVSRRHEPETASAYTL